MAENVAIKSDPTFPLPHDTFFNKGTCKLVQLWLNTSTISFTNECGQIIKITLFRTNRGFKFSSTNGLFPQHAMMHSMNCLRQTNLSDASRIEMRDSYLQHHLTCEKSKLFFPLPFEFVSSSTCLSLLLNSIVAELTDIYLILFACFSY